MPAAVDELVANATARAPEDRFPDGNAFAAAIRGEPSTPAATVVAPAAATATWPFATPPRWDAARLGRTVVFVFIALFLMALAALGYRLASSADDAPDRADERERPVDQSPVDQSPLPVGIELEDYVGVPANEAAGELEGLGLEVVPKTAECKDYPEGYVCKQEPKAGEILTEGDSVTLEISFSEDDEEDHGEGKEDKAPPGQEKKDKDD